MYSQTNNVYGKGGYNVSGLLSDSDVPQKYRSKKKATNDGNEPTAPLKARVMDAAEAADMRRRYEAKVGDRQLNKYELVAGFVVADGGVIESYCTFRHPRIAFELTDRRRRLIQRYYSAGRQCLVLYVNDKEFEHYMPLAVERGDDKATMANRATRQRKSAWLKSRSQQQQQQLLQSHQSSWLPWRRSSVGGPHYHHPTETTELEQK